MSDHRDLEMLKAYLGGYRLSMERYASTALSERSQAYISGALSTVGSIENWIARELALAGVNN
jgi:hypothetical protein